jgi:hypothetical protein
MVIAAANWTVACASWALQACFQILCGAALFAEAEPEKQFQIERLDPATRAKALAALTGLVILMIGLMLLAWLGARWARAYGHHTPLSFERRKPKPIDPDDWANKPLPTSGADEDDPAPA